MACVLVVWAWHEGYLAGWLALAAVAAGFRTLSAMTQMRVYNAWAASWNAMGGMEEEEAPPRRAEVPRRQVRVADAAGAIGDVPTGRRTPWKLLTWTAACLVVLPVLEALGIVGMPEGIAVPWGVACVFLVCRLLAWVYRLVFGRRAPEVEAKAGGGGSRVAQLLTWGAVLCLTVPIWMGFIGARGQVPDAVGALWCASLLFLLCRLLAWVYRLVFRRGVRIERVEAREAVESGGSGGQVACCWGLLRLLLRGRTRSGSCLIIVQGCLIAIRRLYGWAASMTDARSTPSLRRGGCAGWLQFAAVWYPGDRQ
jgi:hypothetical protein